STSPPSLSLGMHARGETEQQRLPSSSLSVREQPRHLWSSFAGQPPSTGSHYVMSSFTLEQPREAISGRERQPFQIISTIPIIFVRARNRSGESVPFVVGVNQQPCCQNIITCSIILNFLNVQMSPRREPDHPAPTQATVVAQFRDYHAEKFSGQGDPRIVDEWSQGLEFIFEVMECRERYRVICAQLQLTGDARLWWNAYWSMRPGEKAGCTWEMLKELIREKYYPTYYRAEMERQFLSLQQGTRTVDEYEREFTRLAAFVPDLVRTEAQRAQRFIDGLYPAVRHNI
ncbi:Unknown protein, partial [Striga hermonthica]